MGGFLAGESYTGSGYTDCTYGLHCFYSGVNAPETEISDTAMIFTFYRPYAAGTGNWTGSVVNKHVYWIIDPYNQLNAANDGRFTGLGTTTTQALAFDKKLDDGLPYEGIVDVPLGSFYTSGCVLSSRYNISNDDVVCITEITAEFE